MAPGDAPAGLSRPRNHSQNHQQGKGIKPPAWFFRILLRRGDPKSSRLGPEETVLQRALNSLPGKTDDFEDAFDRIRLAGEILVLIVADGIRSSAERLVQWMNTVVGSAPYKFGLVELCLYDLPDASRLVVPKTLLRIREASRHVVSVNLQGPAREHVTVTVSAPNEQPKTRKIAPSGIPLTEEGLTRQIAEKNSPEVAALAEQLRSQLNLSGLKKGRFHPQFSTVWMLPETLFRS